jgi:hypothetical protein
MEQLFIQGTTTELETTVYTVQQSLRLTFINNLRFSCSVASVVTISTIKNSTEYDLYTLTLEEGDTVTDSYSYYLSSGDEFRIKADVVGITYTVNVTQG